MDVIRRLLHDGKELTDICNQVMDICLAPDSNTGGGIGCDNMTVLIVALLHGRTKEEWYAWVKERVETKYGYGTPEELPQIYPKNREPSPYAVSSGGGMGGRPMNGSIRIPVGSFGFGALARALAAGGVTFSPEGWPNNGSTGGLMFGAEDSEEEESDDENGAGSTSSMPGYLSDLHAPPSRDVTSSLKAQLDALRTEDQMDMDGIVTGWAKSTPGDGSSSNQQIPGMSDVEMEPTITEGDEGKNAGNRAKLPAGLGRLVDRSLVQGEAPPPPIHRNSSEENEQPQLQHHPLDTEEPSGAVKLEGLMDSSESPFKTDI